MYAGISQTIIQTNNGKYMFIIHKVKQNNAPMTMDEILSDECYVTNSLEYDTFDSAKAAGREILYKLKEELVAKGLNANVGKWEHNQPRPEGV